MEPSYYFNGDSTGVDEFREGAIYMYAQETNIVDEYLLNLKLDYSNVADLQLKSIFEGPFTGSYSVSIRHNGTYNEGTSLPVVIFEMTI